MKKLLIFDLDGTLLNTITDLGMACNYALESLGYAPHPLSAYPFMVGHGVRNLIERSKPDATPQQIEEILRVFKEYYDTHNKDNTQPYEGVHEMLRTLTDNGIAVAVASNKYQEAVSDIVTHFFPDIPFVSLSGQIEGRNTKPDPSIVFHILSEHPTPKAEVLYVGDSAVDIETARRACIQSVGVTWGFSPVSHLRRACADHIVSTPAEILTLAGLPSQD